MRVKLIALLFCLAVILGCGSKPPAENATSTENRDNASTSAPGAVGSSGKAANAPKPPGLMDRLTSKTYTVPAGTVVSVRLGETLGFGPRGAAPAADVVTIEAAKPAEASKAAKPAVKQKKAPAKKAAAKKPAAKGKSKGKK